MLSQQPLVLPANTRNRDREPRRGHARANALRLSSGYIRRLLRSRRSDTSRAILDLPHLSEHPVAVQSMPSPAAAGMPIPANQWSMRKAPLSSGVCPYKSVGMLITPPQAPSSRAARSEAVHRVAKRPQQHEQRAAHCSSTLPARQQTGEQMVCVMRKVMGMGLAAAESMPV